MIDRLGPGVFRFQPLTDLRLQRGQIFGPEFFGQLIVDLGLRRRFDRFH